MLKKLFGYDFRSIGKNMWLFTVIAVGMTVIGCLSATALWNMDWEHQTVPDIAFVAAVMSLVMVIIISVVALVAYGVLATIMIIKRYYTNLFTDEGYLTFTLPVKVSAIFNAKVLAGALWTVIVGVVEIICIAALLVACVSPRGIAEVWSAYEEMFTYMLPQTDVSVITIVLLIAEYILTIMASMMYELLLIYVCITLASVIAKKARVILGVGIYFGANSITSTIVSVASMVISSSFTAYITANPEVSMNSMMSFYETQMHIQFAFTFVVYAGIAVGAYFLNKHLLKNKLNLP